MKLISSALFPLVLVFVSACSNVEEPDCGSEASLQLVNNTIKEELEFGIQNTLDSQKDLGSYDATELEDAVNRLQISLSDIRTSRDDPNSQSFSCRATIALDLSERVEKDVNESRAFAELGSVRELGNSYKMKRRGGEYQADFDYFVQPTDDGEKVFVEIDDDSSTLSFLSEVFAFYLLSDEIREKKIEQDQAEAAERREELQLKREQDEMEREVDAANEGRAEAALNTAKVERQLASERINAVWLAMPQGAQRELDTLHSAWVREMNARCAAEAAGSDRMRSLREARELACQTRNVRSCATTLNRNVGGPSSRRWNYCSF